MVITKTSPPDFVPPRKLPTLGRTVPKVLCADRNSAVRPLAAVASASAAGGFVRGLPRHGWLALDAAIDGHARLGRGLFAAGRIERSRGG